MWSKNARIHITISNNQKMKKNKKSNILMARVTLTGACRAITCTIINMVTNIENHYPDI